MKPALLYHPIMAVEANKVGCMHLSVSHDGDYVVAFVTIEAASTSETTQKS
jgi:holo-[acyl-carrier protein] synthase